MRKRSRNSHRIVGCVAASQWTGRASAALGAASRCRPACLSRGGSTLATELDVPYGLPAQEPLSGSVIHWPSTTNLYSYTPGGRGSVRTNAPLLCRRMRLGCQFVKSPASQTSLAVSLGSMENLVVPLLLPVETMAAPFSPKPLGPAALRHRTRAWPASANESPSHSSVTLSNSCTSLGGIGFFPGRLLHLPWATAPLFRAGVGV
jgi:hypothetical protein